ncbi:hypothetical protein ASB62_05230 [Chlorobium limicola]|uniref:Uncharacterized protein n=1 Tax=Chlorobium limicola TaxID=1092 RepID=A0A101JMI1_CHLLI|nr:hypothetical protein ASB62_05230 [Chlorobium limicola]
MRTAKSLPTGKEFRSGDDGCMVSVMLLITVTFRGSGRSSGARSKGFSCMQVIAKAIMRNA